MVSTMRNHAAIAVAPMKPVITPSRRKLCGRSAIGVLCCNGVQVSLGENTQTQGIFQANSALSSQDRACRSLAPFSPSEGGSVLFFRNRFFKRSTAQDVLSQNSNRHPGSAHRLRRRSHHSRITDPTKKHDQTPRAETPP